MNQYIAILGASADRTSMSNKAVRAYMEKGYSVIPVSETEKEIEGPMTTSRVRSRRSSSSAAFKYS